MISRAYIVLLGVLLTGCNQEQTGRLQENASAAIGSLHQVVKDASVPLANLKQQASAALGVAEVVSPELKERMDTLRQQASEAKGVIKQVASAAR